MQFIYFASVALMTYGIQAQTPPAQVPAGTQPPAPPAQGPTGIQTQTPPAQVPAGAKPTKEVPLPNYISMDCASAWMPFSEADVASLSSNDTHPVNTAQYSTIPTEAACKGPTGTNLNGLCQLDSCKSHPVCNTCVEVIISGNTTTTGKTVIPQVNCTNNYFFGTLDDKVSNYCTDGTDKTYTCSGGCQGTTTCKVCISSDDPALKAM